MNDNTCGNNSDNTCGNKNCQIKCGQLSLCGKCKKIHYCSRECQKTHWPVHKPICKKSIELVGPINGAKKEIRRITDPVLQNQSRMHLDKLCVENREYILANSKPPGDMPTSEEYFKNNSISDIRDIAQKELSSLLAEIDRLTICKQKLNNKKLELEEIINKCAIEFANEFNSEYINRYCAPVREEIDILDSRIAKIDTAIESCTDMHCRMRILICDSYTVPTLCIKCSGTKFEDNTLYRCIKCKMAIYCSKDCMRDDHIAHQLSCKKV
jgi:hypothetical protein